MFLNPPPLVCIHMLLLRQQQYDLMTKWADERERLEHKSAMQRKAASRGGGKLKGNRREADGKVRRVSVRTN